uniref:Uncharacterized protein n=1 Tax=Lepeophtheirus salmonis TaxID=72036 RepID=A0A0K2TY25_LEPSM
MVILFDIAELAYNFLSSIVTHTQACSFH